MTFFMGLILTFLILNVFEKFHVHATTIYGNKVILLFLYSLVKTTGRFFDIFEFEKNESWQKSSVIV